MSETQDNQTTANAATAAAAQQALTAAVADAPKFLPLGSIDQILGAQDLREEVVNVPEWGCSVRVRSFTKADQQAMREQATIAGEMDDQRLEVLMVIHGVIEPKFSLDQYEQLRNKSATALDRVLTAITSLSGIGKDAIEAAQKKSS